MNKRTALILTIGLLAVFCLIACGCNKDGRTQLSVAVITDTHVIANSLLTAENYDSYATEDKMVHITDAVLSSVADELIEKEYKYVFCAGDMTESGDLASHEVCVAAFKKLEDNGIKVFVINGNHDLADDIDEIGERISPNEFKELYNDFGYSEAVATYSGTLSYVADLDKNYRLIAIDMMGHYGETADEYKEYLTDEHIAWISEQVKACVDDGKTPIAMSHDSLLMHYPAIAKIAMDVEVRNKMEALAATFADQGLEYLFTGHYHVQDINSATTESGNTLYDISTASLSYYPCAYREIEFTTKKVFINTTFFDNINVNYLSQFSTAEERAALDSSLQTYCYNHSHNEIANIVRNLGKDGGTIDSLSADGSLKTLLNIVADVMDEAVSVPFYIKDEEGNISLERLLSGYGITLPATNFKNLPELASYLICSINRGDENISDGEVQLIKYAVLSVFYYLNGASAELAAAFPENPVINIDCNKLFVEGVLECYDSNLIPFVLLVLKENLSNFLYGTISGLVGTDFTPIQGADDLINTFTYGLLSGIGDYFGEKDIRIGLLVTDGVFVRYAPDLKNDVAPADNTFVITKKK